jgi:hypothetical protein
LRKYLLPLALFLVLPQPATMAQTKFEISPFLGYRLGGDFQDLATGATIDLEESSSYGLILDIPLSGNGQLEILWSRQETELDSGGFLVATPPFHIDVDYLHVGGVYNVERVSAGTRTSRKAAIRLSRSVAIRASIHAAPKTGTSFPAGVTDTAARA